MPFGLAGDYSPNFSIFPSDSSGWRWGAWTRWIGLLLWGHLPEEWVALVALGDRHNLNPNQRWCSQ